MTMRTNIVPKITPELVYEPKDVKNVVEFDDSAPNIQLLIQSDKIENQFMMGSLGGDDTNLMIIEGKHLPGYSAERMKRLQESYQSCPQHVHDLLGEQGFGLCMTHNLAHGILQHFSGKPWLYLDTDRQSYHKYEREWIILFESFSNNRFKFLSELWDSNIDTDWLEGLKPLHNFIGDFSFILLGVKQMKLMAIEDIQVFQNDVIRFPRNQDESFALDDPGDKRPLFFLHPEQGKNGTQFLSLIAPLDSILPNKYAYGEYLISQLISSKTIANGMELFTDITDILSNTKPFDEVNGLIEKMARGRSFNEIWNIILPNKKPHYTVRELVNIEEHLTKEEACNMRIKLVQVLTTEVFYPLRKLVQEEKSKQEEIAYEMMERRKLMESQHEKLQGIINASEKEILEIKEEMSKAKESLSTLENKREKDLQRESSRMEKLEAAQSNLNELKEADAIFNFLSAISSIPPDKTKTVLTKISGFGDRWQDPLPKLVKSISDIFHLDENISNSSYLVSRLKKDKASDRAGIRDRIDSLMKTPTFEVEDNGDISIQTVNLITSSLMGQIIECVEKRRPAKLKITCQGNLIFDTDFDMEIFHGMNLIFVADSIMAADSEIIINVSGYDAEEFKETKARNGLTEGANGEDGLHGKNGGDGGNVYMEALTVFVNVDNVTIVCEGGKGSHGQAGGAGAKGRRGVDGVDGSEEYPGFYNFTGYQRVSKGSKGGIGESGGQGGLGGYGGYGGNGGTAVVKSKNRKTINISFKDGDDGGDGSHGNHGANGDHGKHGKDHGWACKSHIYGWEELKGYSIYFTEAKNIFGYVVGYVIHSGSEPPYPQAKSTQAKKVTKKKARTVAKNQISQTVVQKMRNSVQKMETNTKDSLSDELDAAETKVTEATTSLLSEKAVNAAAMEETDRQKDYIQHLQLKEFDISNVLNASQKRQENIMGAVLAAKTREEEAEMKREELQQMAANLKAAQEQSLQISSSIQHQMKAEQSKKSEVMQLKDGTSLMDEVNDATAKPGGTTGRIIETESSNELFNLFLHLRKNLDPDVNEELESSFQKIQLEFGILSSEERKFLTNLKETGIMNNVEYVKTEMIEDLKIARKYVDKFKKLTNKNNSKNHPITDVRLLKTDFEIKHLPQDLYIYLEDARNKTLSNYELNIWLKAIPNKGTVLSNKSEQELRHLKTTLFKKGLDLFSKIKKSFPTNQNKDLQIFLRELIKSVDEEKDPNNLENFRGFCKTRPEFSFDGLKRVLKTISKSPSVDIVQDKLELAQLMISHLEMKSKEMYEIYNMALELKVPAGIDNSLPNQIILIYQSFKREPILQETLGKIQQQEQKSILQQIIQLTESKYGSQSFANRKKIYKDCRDDSSPSNLGKILKKLYSPVKNVSIMDQYLNLKFAEFLSQLESSKTYSRSEDFNEMLRIIETGRLVDGSIVPFTKLEISQIEAVLWNVLSKGNQNNVEEVENLLLKSPLLKFDVLQVVEDCDISACSIITNEILTNLNDFVPIDATDSGITEARKIRRYFEFTLLRIKTLLIEGSKCGKMKTLRNEVDGLEKSETNKVIKKLEHFLSECSSSKIEAKEEFLEYLNDLDLEKLDDFTSLYFTGAHIIRWEDLPSPDFDKFLEKLDVSRNLPKKDASTEELVNNGNDENPTSTIKPGYHEVRGLIQHLIEPKGAPLTSLKQLYGSIHKEKMEEWRKIQNILDVAASLQEKLVTQTPNIYLAAAFSERVQTLVLQGLNFSNVFEREIILYEQFPDPPEVDRKLQKDNQPQLVARIQALKFKFTSYPFVNFFWPLTQAFYPTSKEKVLHELLSKHTVFLTKEGAHATQQMHWDSVMSNFKGVKSTSKMTTMQLASILIHLKLEDPLSRFIIRLMENLFGSKIQMLKEIEEKKTKTTLTREIIFDIFVNKFGIENVSRYLLQGEELAYFEALGIDFQQNLRGMVCSLNPSSWAGHLERHLFNSTFKFFAAKSTLSLDQRDSLAATVSLATKLSENKKKVLRAIQKVTLYNAFKLNYLFQDGKDRLQWISSIRSATEKAGIFGFPLLDSSRDAKLLLTLIRDISISDWEHIINHKFPQNWIKCVISRCLLLDFQLMDDDGKETRMSSLEDIWKKPDSDRVYFLILLHEGMRKELSLENSSRSQPYLFHKILNAVANADFLPKQMQRLNSTLTLNPMQYWPTLIRDRKIRIMFSDIEIVEALLLMDESHGEDMVDQLIEKFSQNKTKLSQEDGKRILAKFANGECILDTSSLKLISEFPTRDLIIRAIADYSENQRKHELELNKLLEAASLLPSNKWSDREKQLLQERVVKILNYLDHNYPLDPETITVEDLTSMVSQCLDTWKQKYGKFSWSQRYQIGDEMITHTIALIYRAVQWKFYDKKITKSPRIAQLVSVLLLIQGLNDKERGRLGEIQTGEGKSCIVAMFSAFCSLLQARVHILTANKVLAQADATEYKKFYQVLGLSSDNNCDKDATGDTERKKRYNNNVVYGELAAYQGDILNTEFHGKGIMEKYADIILVDEVDSLLLDKGANMLYLSHQIPELKFLRPVFLLIWDTVQNCKVNKDETTDPSNPYKEAHVHAVRKAVEVKLEEQTTSKEIQVPPCLMKFIQSRIGVWVKRAFLARFMPTDEDFLVGDSQEIVNVDKDTGVEQGNMQLSLGLHQFLQLKHKSRLTPESLKCIFMSNLYYFTMDKHRGKVFGITGTLGGENEKQLLGDVYKVDFFQMPRYISNKKVEETALISKDKEQWLKNICASVLSHSEKQPTLIITETLAELAIIHDSLMAINRGVVRLNIEEYKSSEKGVDFTKKVKDRFGLKPGDVVISTNLGGRGTDLEIHESGKELGLHVILSYLPANLRVERQAFGRTSRAGQNGTVQFIIRGSGSLLALKRERTRKEVKRLDIIRKRDIPRIKMEDELYQRYSVFYREKIQTNPAFKRHRKRVRIQQLNFLNNRWAVWLDYIKPRLDHLHLQREVGRENIMNLFEIFQQEMLSKVESNDVTIFAEFTSELIKLGITYEDIAWNTFFSTLIEGKYAKMMEVGDEGLEKIKEGTWNAWQGIKGVFNKEKTIGDVFQEVNNTFREWQNAPSDLDIGLSILETAIEVDEHFTDAASLYRSGLLLQKDCSQRIDAKKSLIDTKRKLYKRMGQNLSCTQWLNEAFKKMERNGEVVAVRGNKFEEQIFYENNLLHIHVDAIQAALPAPFNATFIKSQVKFADTEKEAEELLHVLMKEDLGLMKGYRFSKKFRINLVEKGFSHLETSLTGTFPPCLTSDLYKFILEHEGTLDPCTLGDIVITKESFLKFLSNKGFTQCVTKAFITIIQDAKTLEIFKNMPPELKSFLTIVGSRLAKEKDTLINPVIFCADSQLSLNETMEAMKSLGWIKNKDIALEMCETPKLKNCPGFNSDEGCTCSLEPSKQLHSSEMYKLYRGKLDSSGLQGFQPSKDFYNELDYVSIPFPNTVLDGTQELIKILVGKGILREPKVAFPSLKENHTIVSNRIAAIKETCNSDGFKSELKQWLISTKSSDSEMDSLTKTVTKLLIDSVGSLYRYGNIRVNYECISTRVHLKEATQRSEELEELIAEGTFDRIIIFDEYVFITENYATLGVMILGIAEIAAGIGLEFISPMCPMLISPLAAFLLSEGSSDVVYSMKHLYRGTRLDGDDYWSHKKRSMAWSATTAPLALLGGMGSLTFGNSFGVKLTCEVLRGATKALIFNFIENNIEQGLKTNTLGLRTILFTSFSTEEVIERFQTFRCDCICLHSKTWESQQAEKLITKIVETSINSGHNETIFDLELEKTYSNISWSLYFGLARQLAKDTLPTSSKALNGLWGSSETTTASCCSEISPLIVKTIDNLITQVKQKIEKVSQLKEEAWIPEETDGTEISNLSDFQTFLDKTEAQIQKKITSRIARYIYKKISGFTMKASLFEEIRSGYSLFLNEHSLTTGEIEVDDEHYEEEILHVQMDKTREMMERLNSSLVKNAAGRTIGEVKKEWDELLQLPEDLEFLQDTRGNYFVAIRSQNSLQYKFVISAESSAFDKFCTWYMEQTSV